MHGTICTTRVSNVIQQRGHQSLGFEKARKVVGGDTDLGTTSITSVKRLFEWDS
jgi:hypothetical protein